ncbi:hypothetical protein H109_06705, partial [Trichophyton interdigitale MR816]
AASLKAIQGMNYLVIMVRLVGQNARALVDSGAIGNFINTEFIKQSRIITRNKDKLYELGGLNEG